MNNNYSPTAYVSYKGSQNPLSFTLRAQATIPCEFQLRQYPWDEQECIASVKILNVPPASLKINKTSSSVTFCPSSLVEYDVKECGFHGVRGGFNVSLSLARRSEFHIFATYIPTSLLVGLGYGTLFLPVDSFPERGGMSLTTLLVFISLYTEMASSLPKASYLKSIDVWFVFGIVYLSLVITVHLATCKSVMTSQRERKATPIAFFVRRWGNDPEFGFEKDKRSLSAGSKEATILRIARVSFGIITFLFVFLYFVVVSVT
ncbi:glycine receptor subunit alpha-3-like [Penaeus japonicus]|uniref:glycine receptor subunit alpha-3-like n=1 Tax=Penaeus japonicus TaxID=27405 RepID=UPI001C7106BE|nr:glycine receptor subunit alpha-3-like [Penaeus japonicus]